MAPDETSQDSTVIDDDLVEALGFEPIEDDEPTTGEPVQGDDGSGRAGDPLRETPVAGFSPNGEAATAWGEPAGADADVDRSRQADDSDDLEEAVDNALSDDDLTVVENDPAEEQSGSSNDAAVVAAPTTDADGPVLVIDLSDTDEGRPAGVAARVSGYLDDFDRSPDRDLAISPAAPPPPTEATEVVAAPAPSPVPQVRRSVALPGRRRHQLRARKSRRVIRHIDPWSVLTFSVLFHLCFFAALLLASVLVWNAAIAAGTIENIENFIRELGDYETFEIHSDVVFRSAVLIAGILTLASSVLIVLLTVVFNLISDLVGGIRVTVVEEETVRLPSGRTAQDSE